MDRLKCTIVVIAGVIPGQVDETYTRQWAININHIEDNKGIAYLDAQGAALNYAASLMNPRIVNWVELKWIWI